MDLHVYSIFDTATGAYMRPFFAQADGAALREFTDIATNAEHFIGQHPEDYSLMKLGMFDDNNGKLYPETPICLRTGLEAVASARKVAPGALAQFENDLTGDPDGQVGNGAQLQPGT